MRPQKRSRGRNGGGSPYQQHNNNPNRGPRPPHRSQTFDSNGPNVKIRGNAYQVFERYLALAREAQTSGDRVAAENFFQHAEHYFRVMSAAGEGPQGQPRPQQMPVDGDMGQGEMGVGEMGQEGPDEMGQGDMGSGEMGRADMSQGEDGQPDDERPVQVQRAPPPPPTPEDDQLPSFITGRPD